MDSKTEPKKKFYKRWWFWVLVIIVIIGLNSGGDSSKQTATNGQTQTSTEQAKPAIKVSAIALATAYKDNEVAADAKYKGKIVEVTGIVDTIGKDILSTPYITLSTGQYSFESIQCMFSKSDEAQLANVTKGKSMTLRGEVSGKMMNIQVSGCSIVQ